MPRAEDTFVSTQGNVVHGPQVQDMWTHSDDYSFNGHARIPSQQLSLVYTLLGGFFSGAMSLAATGAGALATLCLHGTVAFTLPATG